MRLAPCIDAIDNLISDDAASHQRSPSFDGDADGHIRWFSNGHGISDAGAQPAARRLRLHAAACLQIRSLTTFISRLHYFIIMRREARKAGFMGRGH